VNEVNTEPKGKKDMPKTSYSKPTVGATGKAGSWRTFDPVVNYDDQRLLSALVRMTILFGISTIAKAVEFAQRYALRSA
jgi:hypothetical protein